MRAGCRAVVIGALWALGCAPGGGAATGGGGSGATPVGNAVATSGSGGNTVSIGTSGGPGTGATVGTTGSATGTAGTTSAAGASGSTGGAGSTTTTGSAEACAGLSFGNVAAVQYASTDVVSFSERHCGPGTSDGSGVVLLPNVHDFQGHDVWLYERAADGSRINEITFIGFEARAQLSGFLGTQNYDSQSGCDITGLGPQGAYLYSTTIHNCGWSKTATDPTGGLVAWEAVAGNSTDGAVEAFTGGGGSRWRVVLAGIGMLDGLGVDRLGNTLVIAHQAGSTEARGVWIDHGGTAHAPFHVGSAGDWELYESVGSGLFGLARSLDASTGTLVEHTEWLASFPTLADRADPAPGWLSSSPDTRLHMVHGGSGYALLPVGQPSTSGCQQVVQIVAADGTRCGGYTFAFGAGACTTRDVTVGYDGTLIQSYPPELDACVSPGHCACTWRWFPALFR